jgi:hypothetical protein
VIFQAAVIFLFLRKQFLLCQKEQGQGLGLLTLARIEAGFLFLGSLKEVSPMWRAHREFRPRATKKGAAAAGRQTFGFSLLFRGAHVFRLEICVQQSHICCAH